MIPITFLGIREGFIFGIDSDFYLRTFAVNALFFLFLLLYAVNDLKWVLFNYNFDFFF